MNVMRLIVSLIAIGSLVASCSPLERANNEQNAGPQQCYDTQQPGVLEILAEIVGSHVCVSGPLTLDTHEVSFQTNPKVTSESVDIYGNRIYVPVSWHDARERGFVNGEFLELSGTLEFREGFECTPDYCRALNLRLE